MEEAGATLLVAAWWLTHDVEGRRPKVIRGCCAWRALLSQSHLSSTSFHLSRFHSSIVPPRLCAPSHRR